jgi:hypothetical protein
MLAEAEASIAQKHTGDSSDEDEDMQHYNNERNVNSRKSRQPNPRKFKQRAWTAPQNGWNQSTETLTEGKTKKTSSPLRVQAVQQRRQQQYNLGGSGHGSGHGSEGGRAIQRVARDRGGRHRPAATSFHNREFQNGSKTVDKDGLVMDGMWDPTFAPSLRRLSQLGFSPNRRRRTNGGNGGNSGNGGNGGSDHRGTYYYHDMVDAPSEVSGHAGSASSADSMQGGGEGASYVVRRRASTVQSGINQWKKELRTPSKKGRKQRGVSERTRGGNYMVEEEEDEGLRTSQLNKSQSNNSQSNKSQLNYPTTPGGSRHSVFKGPANASHALSEQQMTLLAWCRRLGVRPCSQKRDKELTGALVSAAFADGVLLCSLVSEMDRHTFKHTVSNII